MAGLPPIREPMGDRPLRAIVLTRHFWNKPKNNQLTKIEKGRTMKLKLLAIVSIGLASLAGVRADPIKIGYSDWPGYTVMEIAKQKGWFKEAGLDVDMVWFDYNASIDALSSGKIDADMIVASDAMVTGASGAKTKIVCLVDYSEGSDMIIGAPGVDSIKDLSGKKVGVELTLVEHMLLLQALKVNGM